MFSPCNTSHESRRTGKCHAIHFKICTGLDRTRSGAANRGISDLVVRVCRFASGFERYAGDNGLMVLSRQF